MSHDASPEPELIRWEPFQIVTETKSSIGPDGGFGPRVVARREVPTWTRSDKALVFIAWVVALHLLASVVVGVLYVRAYNNMLDSLEGVSGSSEVCDEAYYEC